MIKLTETICLTNTFNALAVACFLGLESTARSILRSYNAMTRTYASTRVAKARRKSLRRLKKARVEAQQAHMLACCLIKLALRNKRSAAWVKTSSAKTTKKVVNIVTRSVTYAVAPPAIVDARAVVADWTPEGLKRRHDEALPRLNATISDYPSTLEGINAEIARIDKVIASIDAEKIKDDEKKAKKKPHSDRRTNAVARKTELTSSYNLAEAHLDFATWEAYQLKSDISPQERAEFAKAARLHSRRKHLKGDAREKAIREQHFKRHMGRGRYTSIDDARRAVEAWEKANTFERDFTVIETVECEPTAETPTKELLGGKTPGEIVYAIDEARAGHSDGVVCDIALDDETLAAISAVPGVGPKAIDKLVKALDLDTWADLNTEIITSRVDSSVTKKTSRAQVARIIEDAQGDFLLANSDKVMVVSDLHANMKVWKEIKERFASGGYSKLVIAGDLIDGGNKKYTVDDSVKLVKAIYEFSKTNPVEIALGNHDAYMLDSDTAEENAALWGLKVEDKKAKDNWAEAQAIKAKLSDEILAWYRQAKLWLDVQGVLVVHAKVVDDVRNVAHTVTGKLTDEQIALLDHTKPEAGKKFWAQTYDGSQGHVVYGHTRHDELLHAKCAWAQPHATCIDAGAKKKNRFAFATIQHAQVKAKIVDCVNDTWVEVEDVPKLLNAFLTSETPQNELKDLDEDIAKKASDSLQSLAEMIKTQADLETYLGQRHKAMSAVYAFKSEIKRMETRAKILDENISLELNPEKKSKLWRASIEAEVGKFFADDKLTYVLTAEATDPELLSEIASSASASIAVNYVACARFALEVPRLRRETHAADIDFFSCAKAFAKRKPSRKMQVAMEIVDPDRNVNEWFKEIFSEIYSDDLEVEPTEDALKSRYGFYSMINPSRFDDATKISTWLIDHLLAAKTVNEIKGLPSPQDALNKLFEKVNFITRSHGDEAWKSSDLYTSLIEIYNANAKEATCAEAQNLASGLVQKSSYTRGAALIVSEDTATVQVTQTMSGKDNVGAATLQKAMLCDGLLNVVSSLTLDFDRVETQGEALTTLVAEGAMAVGASGGGGSALTTDNDMATCLVYSLADTMTGVQSYVMSVLNSSVRSEVWGTPDTNLIGEEDIRVVIYDASKINLSERATLAGADGSNINSLLSAEPLIGQIRGILARKGWKEVEIDNLVSALFKGQQYSAKILINDKGKTYTVLDAIKDGYLDDSALSNENYELWLRFARTKAREMGYFPFYGIDVANIKERGKDHFSKIFDPSADSVKVDEYVANKGGVLVLDPKTYGETLSLFSWVIIPSPHKSDMAASYQLSGMSPWAAMTDQEKQEQYEAFCKSYNLDPERDNHKQSLLRKITGELKLNLANPQSAVKSPLSYLWRQFSTQGLPNNATRRIVMLDINFAGLSLAEVKKPTKDGSLRKVMHWRAPLLVPQAVMVNYEVDRKILKDWTENWDDLIADDNSTLSIAYRHCEEVHNSRITKIKKKKGGVSGKRYTLELFKEAIFALYDVACVMYIDSRIGFFSCADTAALQGDDDGDYIAWDTDPLAVANAERTKKFWQRVFKDNGVPAPAIELDKKARLNYAEAWTSKADLLATGMHYPQLAEALVEAGLLIEDNDGFVPCILGWGFNTLIEWSDRISKLDKAMGEKMWIRLAANPQGPVGIGSDMAVAALTSIKFKEEDGKILFATEMDRIRWMVYTCLAFGVQVSIDNAKRAYKVLLLVLAAAKKKDGSPLIDFSEELTKGFLDEWSVVGTEVSTVDFHTEKKKLWLGDKLMALLAQKDIELPGEVYLKKEPSVKETKEIDLFDPTNNCFSMDVFTTLGSVATGLDTMEVMLWKLKLPQLQQMIRGDKKTIDALQERVNLFPQETHLKVGAQFVLRALTESTPLSSDMRLLTTAKESWAGNVVAITNVDQVVKVVRGKLFGLRRFGEKAPASALYVRDVFAQLNIRPCDTDTLLDTAIKDYNTTYTIDGEGQYSYLELIKGFAVAESPVDEVDQTPFWQMMIDAYADQEELAHKDAIRIANYCADQVIYNLIEVMTSNLLTRVNKVQEAGNFKDFVDDFARRMKYADHQKKIFGDMLWPEVSSQVFANTTAARRPFVLIAAGLKAGFSAGMANQDVLRTYHGLVMDKLLEGDYHRIPWSRAVEAANADIFKAAVYSIRIMRAVSATNATSDNGLITVSSSIKTTDGTSRKFAPIEDHRKLNLMSLIWGKLSGVRNTLKELQAGKVPRRLDIDATAYRRVFNVAWALAAKTGKPVVGYSLFGNKAPKSLSTLTLMGLLGGEFEAPNGERFYLVSQDSFRSKGKTWSAPITWSLYTGAVPKGYKFQVQSSVTLVELLRKEGTAFDQRFVSEKYLEHYLGGKMKYLEPLAAWDKDFICMRGAVLRFRKHKDSGQHEDFSSFVNYCVSTLNGAKARISYDSFRLRYATAFADRQLIKGFLQDAYGRLSDKILLELAKHGRAKMELMFSLREANDKMKYSMHKYVDQPLAALPVPVEGYSRQIGNLMRRDPLFGNKVGAYLASSDPNFLNNLCYMAANAVLLHKMTGVGTLSYEFKPSTVKAPQTQNNAQVEYGYEGYEDESYDNTPTQTQPASPAPQPQAQVPVQMPQTFPAAPQQPQVQVQVQQAPAVQTPAPTQANGNMVAMMQQQIASLQAALQSLTQPQPPAQSQPVFVGKATLVVIDTPEAMTGLVVRAAKERFSIVAGMFQEGSQRAVMVQATANFCQHTIVEPEWNNELKAHLLEAMKSQAHNVCLCVPTAEIANNLASGLRAAGIDVRS